VAYDPLSSVLTPTVAELGLFDTSNERISAVAEFHENLFALATGCTEEMDLAEDTTESESGASEAVCTTSSGSAFLTVATASSPTAKIGFALAFLQTRHLEAALDFFPDGIRPLSVAYEPLSSVLTPNVAELGLPDTSNERISAVAEFHENLLALATSCTDECSSDATPIEGESDANEPVSTSAC